MAAHDSAIPNITLDEIIRVISALVNAKTWEQMKTLLERERTILLSNIIDQRLAVISRAVREGQDEDSATWLDRYRYLLQRCRELGIKAAMEEFEMPLTWIEISPKEGVYLFVY